MFSPVTKRIAAIDLGSNSFHMTLAEITDGKLIVHHKEKCKVRLAAGLDENLYLSPESIERALITLSTFGKLLREFQPQAVFAVGTFTFRTAKNITVLTKKSREVLPYDINILSGEEEASLIYQGVYQRASIDKPTLVIDIGGGSTELIIGHNSTPVLLHSVGVGCVSLTHNFFVGNTISDAIFTSAIDHAKGLMQPLQQQLCGVGWQHVLGTSGSIGALAQCAAQLGLSTGELTLGTLNHIKRQLLKADAIDNIQLPGIAQDRLPVICGGLAVLIAAFEVFSVQRLNFCNAALREGLLFRATAQLSETVNI